MEKQGILLTFSISAMNNIRLDILAKYEQNPSQFINLQGRVKFPIGGKVRELSKTLGRNW